MFSFFGRIGKVSLNIKEEVYSTMMHAVDDFSAKLREFDDPPHFSTWHREKDF